MSDSRVHLTRVAAARWRLALTLTAIMTLTYVGFILLIAFNKPLLGTILMPGLSLGIVLGVLLIITGFAARKTRSTEHFYAAGRSITAFQNGLALAGDYMSAASFLGIAGL